jgi:hypothetical protein
VTCFALLWPKLREHLHGGHFPAGARVMTDDQGKEIIGSTTDICFKDITAFHHQKNVLYLGQPTDIVIKPPPSARVF